MKAKSILFFCGMVVCCSATYTQPVIKAQKIVGGSLDDDFSCMIRTTDGGLLAGGSSYSNISGDKTENSKGYSDYWIVKFNANGKKQWDKTIGDSKKNTLVAMMPTSDGGYLLGGQLFSVTKLDQGFNIVSEKTYEREPEYEGAFYYNVLYSMQPTSDGGFILSGTSQNYDDIYTTDFFVVKCDNTGNAQWSVAIPAGEAASAYAQETNGGYIVAGSSVASYFLSYFKAVKLDLSGNVQWIKNYNYIIDEDYNPTGRVTCALSLSGGNFIIGGYYTQDTSIAIGSADYRLLKIDGSGNVLQDKRIGGTGYDQLYSITKTSDGGYILGGASSSDISGDKTENHYGTGSVTNMFDYWVVKTDENFNVQWDKTIGGDVEDDLHSVLEVSPNRYLLGGTSISGISGNKKFASKGGTDYWGVVVDYKPPVAADTKVEFSVYPNPATTVINIQLKGKSVFSLANQSGKIIASKTIENKGSFDVSKLKTGVYFISTPSGAKKQFVIAK